MNNDPQSYETEPGAENQEKPLTAEQQARAAQWAESFPPQPNPWLSGEEGVEASDQTFMPEGTPEPTAISEDGLEVPQLDTAEATTDEATETIDELQQAVQELGVNPDAVDEQPSENPVVMSANTPNQIRNTSNQVTAAVEKAWNEGDGGQSLSDAYDSLRGKLGTKDIQQLAQKAEPDISKIEHQNANGGAATLNKELEKDFGDGSAIADAQIESDLHDLTISAGTIAMGAQATAENAAESLKSSNDDAGLEEAQQALQSAQSQIETLTRETEEAARAVEEDRKTAYTAEGLTNEAESMIAEAQQNLQQAAEDAEERKEKIGENQELVDQLVDSGATTTEEINEGLDEGKSLEQVLGESPNITSANIDTTNITDPSKSAEALNPELTTPVEDDREGPLVSIFG